MIGLSREVLEMICLYGSILARRNQVEIGLGYYRVGGVCEKLQYGGEIDIQECLGR